MSKETVTKPQTIHDTFVIERTYAKPVARVFAAFADAAKKRRWYAEGDSHHVERFEMDFRIGGWERSRYRMKEGTPIAGAMLGSEIVYHDIIPDQRIVMAQTMTIGDHRMSVALITIELTATANGTALVCTHQAAFFEGADGPAMRKAGWQKLLAQVDTAL